MNILFLWLNKIEVSLVSLVKLTYLPSLYTLIFLIPCFWSKQTPILEYYVYVILLLFIYLKFMLTSTFGFPQRVGTFAILIRKCDLYCILVWFFFSVLRKMFSLFQIRTLGMLRSRFESLPGAFNACLIPEEQGEPKKKGLKATLSRNFSVVSFVHLKF